MSDSETLINDLILEEGSPSPPDSEYCTDSESSSPTSPTHPLESISLREFLFGNNVLLDGAVSGQGEEGFAGQLSFDSHHDLSESLHNEPYEVGDHSSAASERGSVRMISPGPGMGGGVVDNRINRADRRYYFVVVPLRLSPQNEHCRGKVASHLVEED